MNEQALQRLLDDAEVYEALMAYVRGSDRNDLELLKAAFNPDATIDYGNVLRGNAWELFTALSESGSGRLEVAQRTILNHIVDFDGVAIAEPWRRGPTAGAIADPHDVDPIVRRLLAEARPGTTMREAL